ncbi:hypothetical protein MRX96_022835 [Rhipicephalus microplus]
MSVHRCCIILCSTRETAPREIRVNKSVNGCLKAKGHGMLHRFTKSSVRFQQAHDDRHGRLVVSFNYCSDFWQPGCPRLAKLFTRSQI